LAPDSFALSDSAANADVGPEVDEQGGFPQLNFGLPYGVVGNADSSWQSEAASEIVPSPSGFAAQLDTHPVASRGHGETVPMQGQESDGLRSAAEHLQEQHLQQQHLQQQQQQQQQQQPQQPQQRAQKPAQRSQPQPEQPRRQQVHPDPQPHPSAAQGPAPATPAPAESSPPPTPGKGGGPGGKAAGKGANKGKGARRCPPVPKPPPLGVGPEPDNSAGSAYSLGLPDSPQYGAAPAPVRLPPSPLYAPDSSESEDDGPPEEIRAAPVAENVAVLHGEGMEDDEDLFGSEEDSNHREASELDGPRACSSTASTSPSESALNQSQFDGVVEGAKEELEDQGAEVQDEAKQRAPRGGVKKRKKRKLDWLANKYPDTVKGLSVPAQAAPEKPRWDPLTACRAQVVLGFCASGPSCSSSHDAPLWSGWTEAQKAKFVGKHRAWLTTPEAQGGPPIDALEDLKPHLEPAPTQSKAPIPSVVASKPVTPVLAKREVPSLDDVLGGDSDSE